MNSERPSRALITRSSAAPAITPTFTVADDRAVAASSHVPNLKDYWWILVRHKWTVVAAVVAALALGLIVTLATTPIYEAVGRIVINRESDDASGLKSADTPTEGTDYDYMVMMDTQTRILESDVIAKIVIRKLNLAFNPAFAGRQVFQSPEVSQPATSTDAKGAVVQTLDPHRESALVAKFQKAMQISTIPRTRLMEIRFSSPDPALAQNTVNTVIDTYIEQNYQTRLDATTRTSVWLSKQLSDLENKVEEAQEKLVRYQEEHGIVGLDEKQNITTAKLDELNRNLTAAEADRIEKESIYRIATSGDPDLLANLDAASPLSKLRSQEADLHRQLAQASVLFDSHYPAVRELQNQLTAVQTDIKAEIDRLAAKYKQEYAVALAREKLLKAALDKQKIEENDLSENAIEYGALKREVESERQLYENLLARSKEVGILTGLHSSNIRIVDPASVPTSPVKPNLPHNLLLSLLVGFAAGMGIAFVVDSIDDGVRSIDQLQTVTALPLLAVIPLEVATADQRPKPETLHLYGGGRLSTVLRPRSDTSEAYRALRTAILLSRDAKFVKVLMITSALPQEGKTTTSVNLSVVLAQQNSRVLLIEGDMRRASICRTLNVKAAEGLNDVLAGSAAPQSVIVPVPGIPNLFLLPAGEPPAYPSELLGSQRMQDLLTTLRDQYDHIVIDTPPALAVTDAVMLSALCDATLLVTRLGTANKAALRRVGEILDQVDANVIGVVLNAMDLSKFGQEYYGRRYYSGYYSE